jgi:hypothetical protein
MSTGQVVIEERLNTAGLTAITGLVMFLVVGVGVTFANTLNGGSVPVVAQVVSYAALVLLVGLFLLSLRIVVRVIESPDGRSLVIVYGVGSLVRQAFTSDQIQSASAQSLSTLQMGGWGYRGSLKFFKRAALVTRRGDALELKLAGDRRFIVTVDNPQDFVVALGQAN